jgi:hypothetical protein
VSRVVDERQDWFQENTTRLLEHIEMRNDAQYELTKKTTTENRGKLQSCRRALKIKKWKATCKWQSKLADK